MSVLLPNDSTFALVLGLGFCDWTEEVFEVWNSDLGVVIQCFMGTYGAHPPKNATVSPPRNSRPYQATMMVKTSLNMAGYFLVGKVAFLGGWAL